MLDSGEQNSFDLAFIDADKGNYLAYYEVALELIRPGGIIGIDNVLWGGSVADPMDLRADTEAIRAVNEFVSVDKRVTVSMIPIGDGLTLARKR
jgi:predicted O-methyltransferase YrrM